MNAIGQSQIHLAPRTSELSGRQDAFEQAHDIGSRIESELNKWVYMPGNDARAMTAAVATGGHVLEKGYYGTAKTLAAKVMAATVGGEFARVQGDTDVTPNDINGSLWLNPETRKLEFLPGPIFANVVLFDEIQRAPEKAQDGLIEVMEEGQVSPHGSKESFLVPDPHLVVATRNNDGLALRAGVIDRFAVYIQSSKQRAAERTIINAKKNQEYNPQVRATANEVKFMQTAVNNEVTLHADVDTLANNFVDYLFDKKDVVDQDESIFGGYRGYMNFVNIAKAASLLRKSRQVAVSDLIFSAPYVFSERVVPTEKAEYDQGISSKDIIDGAVKEFLVPKLPKESK